MDVETCRSGERTRSRREHAGSRQESSMAGRQANIITPGMLRRMLGYVRRSRYPQRNRVIVLLAVKAGLRACEIAGLEWSMVLDGKGSIGWSLNVWDAIAKKRAGRRVPLAPERRRPMRGRR